MLAPDRLDVYADEIVALYSDLYDSILVDMARRIGNLDFASAGWQAQRLMESGLLYKDIIKRLAKLTRISPKNLARILTEAGVKSIQYDDKIYKRAGLNVPPLRMSPAMTRTLTAGMKLADVLTNLTRTTATSAQQTYINATNLAYMQVTSGALSYDQAIRNAIKSALDEPLIHYPSGHVDHIEVAVRRAVMTGLTQTTAQMQMDRAAEVGANLVEVSAHWGARNKGTGWKNHASWQGKIYSIGGKNPNYPNFEQITGYGKIDGYAGVNCRHTHYPYFEGLSTPALTAGELKEINDKSVMYNGTELSFYEAQQAQRAMERKIRKWKREANMLEAAKRPNGDALMKVREWQARLREFLRQTKLPRQSAREQIY